MSSYSFFVVFLVASFGAFLQELIHWYELRAELAHSRYDKMMRSAPYWIITGLMIIASGVGTFVWCHRSGPSYELRDYMVFGAAFPLFLKKAVSALGEQKGLVLGKREWASWRDYFQLG